jgi:hypothetical protein
LVPVWRLRYRVRAGLYEATVDAVEGRLLAARAPENDRHRIPVAFLGLGLAALAVGGLLRVLLVFPLQSRAAGHASGMGEAIVYVVLAAFVVLAMFATYAWNVVRYDAERIYEDGRLRGEYVNKPPATGLERFWERSFGALGHALDPTRSRRNRG